MKCMSCLGLVVRLNSFRGLNLAHNWQIQRVRRSFWKIPRLALQKKIIGFKFGMDDKQSNVEEAVQNVKGVEDTLKENGLLIAAIEMTVCGLIVLLFC